MKRLTFLAAALLLFADVSFGIVISGGDSGHLTAPTDDPGWARSGSVGTNGSGVYLGNGWVITANHVSSKTYFTVDGDATYNKMAGEEYGVQLDNLEKTSKIDLYMFRVDTSAGNLTELTPTPIASSAPSEGSQATHIGTGDGQTSSTETTWYVDTGEDPYIWETSPFPGADAHANGYYLQTNRDKRWAFEEVYQSDDDFDNIEGFSTIFNDDADYGITVEHDSGSGLFVKNNGEWELAGIAHAIGSYSGQPDRTRVYGNTSYYSDLSQYSGQINDIITIPEPASLLTLGLGFLYFRQRKQPVSAK
ncbi:trypsin-like peptidase domain-containing protein [Sedimentisphaera salicampi]|uniref:Trypsin n=1 Tax=Sedimentisphaera salicampi TaxID=1941349 RepID=A0A1W6LJM1_9BACT|nr:trypsin-like peptidase domain-containing protein [Sedimentisphaera salicampi]ARN55952.1 Trypsin [Sedimentisphaera salicampi]OXU15868.1 Trypsin [Sedimentisphaera salicampi]